MDVLISVFTPHWMVFVPPPVTVPGLICKEGLFPELSNQAATILPPPT